MRIMRALLALVLLVTAGLSPRPAYAHASTIKGLVTLTPERPAPGAPVRLQVDMLDAYNADVPGARLRAAFVTDGKPAVWSATLREEPLGVYTGDLRTPAAGQAVILFEAVLPDGKWYGEVYVMVGPGGRPVSQEPVEFSHEDQLKQQAAAAKSASAPLPPPPQAAAPPEPAPASVVQLRETVARVSRPSPLPWVLSGGAAAVVVCLLVAMRAEARRAHGAKTRPPL